MGGRDKAGHIARYDFATLACEPPTKASLAALFADRCVRKGKDGWNSHDTSRHCCDSEGVLLLGLAHWAQRTDASRGR